MANFYGEIFPNSRKIIRKSFKKSKKSPKISGNTKTSSEIILSQIKHPIHKPFDATIATQDQLNIYNLNVSKADFTSAFYAGKRKPDLEKFYFGWFRRGLEV